MADPQTLSPGSVDPTVHIPSHVTAGSIAADKLHEQFYPKDPEQAAAPNKEAIPQPPQPQQTDNSAANAQAEVDRIAAETAASQAATQAPEPTHRADPVVTNDGDDNDQTWRHKFLSMQGRYNAQAKSVGVMEQQMREIAQELIRTQSLLAASQQAPPMDTRQASVHKSLITEEDRNNYGDDLIDLTRRAAREVVTPELEALRAENSRLNKTVSRSVKMNLFDTVAGAVPNWRDINKTTQWRAWLTLPNIYTGQIRQRMLDDAVTGADAPKVIQMFRDFLSEANATGMQFQPAQAQHQEQALAPRSAAIDLNTLASPGKAKPAAGNNIPQPSDKPTYTRAFIRGFYNDSRKGLYAGREAEYRRIEADLTLAQAEGRIQG